ncbi:MAG: hypothetical protein OEW19_04970 [Acidobacteriota bacterium]|nr:hypothetical protein [Acidobacteriota bacterium]
MRIWTIFWLTIVAVIAVFAVANWQVLMAPTTITLLITEVTAPLGLTLLGVIAGLALLFLVFLVWLETRALVELGYARRTLRPEPGSVPREEPRAELEREVVALRAEPASRCAI